MKTYTIKCTSKMSKGMELTGNELSGDTFGAREYIKEHWDGKWNAASKTWIVNPEKVIRTIEEKKWGFARVLSISDKVAEPVAIPLRQHGVSGWCPICKDWTYGDCIANGVHH